MFRAVERRCPARRQQKLRQGTGDAAGIPTAKWERFDDAEAAREFVRRRGAPIVVKADGLAAGKGVVVAATEAEALAAIDDDDASGAFGEAGAAVVIEECLTGEEVSLVRAVRWRLRAAARRGAGPQARRRRRYRPEHRRDGRLFAAARR